MSRNVVALAIFGGLLFGPSVTAAYEQTMTCDASGKYACRQGELAKPVRWPQRCVPYYINELGTSDIVNNADTFQAIRQSFLTWNGVEGGEFTMQYAGLTNEDRAEHISARGAEGNANVIMWRDRDWPYASKTAFAITSVTFDPTTGLIADADVEFNSQHHRFTVGDDDIAVDVQNTLTHEVGHFFGLDHTSVAAATMFGSAPLGEVGKRSLHADDVAGLLAAYPSVGVTPSCDEELPDYFQKPIDDDKGCCTTVDGRPDEVPVGLIALLGLTLLRRRRHA